MRQTRWNKAFIVNVVSELILWIRMPDRCARRGFRISQTGKKYFHDQFREKSYVQCQMVTVLWLALLTRTESRRM